MKYAPLALALFFSAAQAQSTTPLDLNTMDQKVVKDFLGAWEIQNEDGTKKCRVRLSREETIGGMVIDVAKGCNKNFPAMADVASWPDFLSIPFNISTLGAVHAISRALS